METNYKAKSYPDQSADICRFGKIRESVKLPILTIDLGPVGELLGTLPGVIQRDPDGKVRVFSKEHTTDGFVYDQDLHLIVRVIGGKVLDQHGRYDLYCPNEQTLNRLFSGSPVYSLRGLAEPEKTHLEQLLTCTALKKSRAVLSPEVPGRKVIEITESLLETINPAGIDKRGPYLTVHESYAGYDPMSRARLYLGDVFLLENPVEQTGYPIAGEVFYQTERFVE